MRIDEIDEIVNNILVSYKPTYQYWFYRRRYMNRNGIISTPHRELACRHLYISYDVDITYSRDAFPARRDYFIKAWHGLIGLFPLLSRRAIRALPEMSKQCMFLFIGKAAFKALMTTIIIKIDLLSRPLDIHQPR